MDWIKHYTDAAMDPKIKLIKRTFGFAGIGRWWTLCELVGHELGSSGDNCFATYHVKDWAISLGLKPDNLKKFVRFLEDFCEISATYSGDILKIGIPKLLKLRDSRNRARHARGTIDKEEDKEEDKEKDKTTPGSAEGSADSSSRDEKRTPRTNVPQHWLDCIEQNVWPKEKDKLIAYGKSKGLDIEDTWKCFVHIISSKARSGTPYANWMRVFQDAVRNYLDGTWQGPQLKKAVKVQCTDPSAPNYDPGMYETINIMRNSGLTDDEIRAKGFSI